MYKIKRKTFLIGFILVFLVVSSFGVSFNRVNSVDYVNKHNPILTNTDIMEFMVAIGIEKKMLSETDISDVYLEDISNDFLNWTSMTREEGAYFIKDMVYNVINSGPQALENYLSKLPIDTERSKPKLTFGPETLDDKMEEQSTIAVYDDIHEMVTQEEKEKWLCNLREVKDEASEMIERYFVPQGPLTAYGIGKGFQMVGLKTWVKEYESLLDDIYAIIDNVAKEKGIEDIPVVFIEMGEPVKDFSRIEKLRPIWGGILVWNNDSYGYNHYSTIGYPAKRYGVKGYTVSGHMTYDESELLRTEMGDEFHQPNQGNLAGHVTDVAGPGNSYADVAFVEFSNVRGVIYTEDQHYPHTGLVFGYYDLLCGMIPKKSHSSC